MFEGFCAALELECEARAGASTPTTPSGATVDRRSCTRARCRCQREVEATALQGSSSLGPNRNPWVHCRDNPASTARPEALLWLAHGCCVGRATTPHRDVQIGTTCDTPSLGHSRPETLSRSPRLACATAATLGARRASMRDFVFRTMTCIRRRCPRGRLSSMLIEEEPP